MAFPKPFDVGVSQGPSFELLADGANRLPERLRVGARTRLTDLLGENFVFFTPAVLFVTAPVSVDPFEAFCEEFNQGYKQLSMRFDRPVFRGLDVGGDAEWNHVLYAMPAEAWRAYKSYLGTVAISDMRRRIYRVRLQDFRIMDPLFSGVAASLDELPIVPCTAICTESNVGSGFMLVEESKPWQAPLFSFQAQTRYADTEAFLDAVSKELPDPYGAKELPF